MMAEHSFVKPNISSNVLKYLATAGFTVNLDAGDTIISEPGKPEIILIQPTETGNKKYTTIKLPDTINETSLKNQDLSNDINESENNAVASIPTRLKKIELPSTEEINPVIIPVDAQLEKDLDIVMETPEPETVIDDTLIELKPEKESETIDPMAGKPEFDLLASLTQAEPKPKPDVAGTPKPEPKPRESRELETHSSNNQDFWTQKLGFITAETNDNEQEEQPILDEPISVIDPEITTPEETVPLVPTMEPEIIDQKSPEISPEQPKESESVETIINESEKIEQIPIETPIINEQSIEQEADASYVFVTSALIKEIKSVIPKTPIITNSPVIPTSSEETKVLDPVINPVVEPAVLDKKPAGQPLNFDNLSLDDYAQLFSQHASNPTMQPTTSKVDPSSLF